ncbi:MAG: 60S ribosomal protein L31 [Candidatus Aenigmarchaeota archaeon]|nr:60S ribosomal protein L31 [Candidatus Aenigmarchaeota archaeon]
MTEEVLSINMRKILVEKARWRRGKLVMPTLKNILKRKLKTEKIKISPKLNEMVWKRGMKNPVVKFKVKIVKDGEFYKIEPI